MPKQLNNSSGKQMNRYHNLKIVEHLASQYVLGTLTAKVQKRVAKLSQHNELLEQRILDWQQRFAVLDEQTPELPASEQSWHKIASALDMTDDTEQEKHSVKTTNILTWLKESLFGKSRNTLAAFSLTMVALFSFMQFSPMMNNTDPLSYVAVLTEQNGQAHLVATTYGDSQKLIVNVVNKPKIKPDQSLELWVISKTDQQARSFGVIPAGETLIEQQLTNAQWRLIKDSHALIVTIEDAGGSPIGEPSELIVSRGLCVRLQEWQNNA